MRSCFNLCNRSGVKTDTWYEYVGESIDPTYLCQVFPANEFGIVSWSTCMVRVLLGNRWGCKVIDYPMHSTINGMFVPMLVGLVTRPGCGLCQLYWCARRCWADPVRLYYAYEACVMCDLIPPPCCPVLVFLRYPFGWLLVWNTR